VIDSAQGVFPMLSYEDGPAAVDWLTRVFGFRERTESRMIMPDGTLGHAEMQTGHGVIFLSTMLRGYESPNRHREHCDTTRAWSSVPWVINGVMIHVDDIDPHYERSKREGARLLSPVEDAPPGRLYRAEDFEGQRWMFLQAR